MARVVRFYEYGGPEVLRIEEVEVPAPGPGEVRIRVKALA
jgi:NADPH:quinone reductase-like Zn-dependent oxidoreductase